MSLYNIKLKWQW